MNRILTITIIGLFVFCTFSGCVGTTEETKSTGGTGTAAGTKNSGTAVNKTGNATRNATTTNATAANAVQKQTIIYEGDVQVGANPGYFEPTLESAPGTGVIDYKIPIASKTKINVKLTWGAQTSDFDLKFYDPKGTEVASSGNTATAEESFELAIKKGFGEYVLRIIPFAVVNEHYVCTITIG